MAKRDDAISAFLAANGWGTSARRKLAGDASFRRYDRLTMDGTRAVLMDAPPPAEDVRPFARLARHLNALGYSAPEVLAEDTQAGFLLLEDLGDDTYTRMLAAGGDERALYQLAVDLLVDLHRRPAAEALPAGLAPYDEDRLMAEALLLTDWFMPAALGRDTDAACRDTDAACRDAYIAAWRHALAPVLAAPPVLRDFHVDNLVWLKDRAGLKACGILDFQDALAGHAAYDLMSLIEDARRDIAPELHGAMLARYLAGFPGIDEAAFRRDFAILAAQRHAKVIGIFTRLWRRDAKPDYLVHIPRVWRLFERALGEAALAPVAGWLDTYLAPQYRRRPDTKE